MTATKLDINKTLVAILNGAIRRQGIIDVRVTKLSKDFETAYLVHDNGVRGAVRTILLLPPDSEMAA